MSSLLLAVPLMLLGMRFSRDDLARRQQRLQRAVGRSDVNAMLYAVLGDRRPDRAAAVATDYLPLQWVPGLERRFVACRSESLAAFRAVYDVRKSASPWCTKTKPRPRCGSILRGRGPRQQPAAGRARYYRLYQKRESR